ncbi:ABC transporter ATP-binding protein [Spirochaeta lutea]|uniref:ABC transporter ATP-binding protein n=1 Tax=Spirochaeta lutea TaxID=1480694 RepID=A0A098QW18_9SPIO|nr:ATP-binding cassette domain-containing protein [Spirochaeta lutea]KGE71859.1 ABC transporter ATP-binding protein [Spirochaeta lutea]
MLEIKAVQKVFHPGTVNENLAIRNIDLSVNQGEFITVIGSNGAGKSTLFNLISGTLLPSNGEIWLHGKNVSKQPEYKRAKHIGRIFQNPLLGTAGNMSLEDNMILALKKGFKGLRISLNHQMREYFQEQLVPLQMGLENRLKDNVGLLSGGQRQALTLLMMVLSKPDLILLDEHTAALDPKNAQVVLDLTLRYIREYGLTTMMITHNMHHAIQYGDRILMMDKGEIILDLSGPEKQGLTVEKLVKKFQEIRNTELENDELLLS